MHVQNSCLSCIFLSQKLPGEDRKLQKNERGCSAEQYNTQYVKEHTEGHHGKLCLHSLRLFTGWLNGIHRVSTLTKARTPTYHGTQHSGHIDGISPGRAVLVSIRHKFRVLIQDLQTDIQYSWFKLQTDTQTEEREGQ